jgi:hypothetical protein
MEKFTLWKLYITGKLKVARVWGIISGAKTAPDPALPLISCSTSPPSQSILLAVRRPSTSWQALPSTAWHSQYILVNNQESWEVHKENVLGKHSLYISYNFTRR